MLTERVLRETDLFELKSQPTHFLSYGQKKRVALADILVVSPEILAMDEPLAWVDPRHERELLGLLDRFKSQRKTMICSTHDPDFAFAWSERVVILKEGTVLGEGEAETIMQKRDLLLEAGFDLPKVVRLAFELGIDSLPRSLDELLYAVRK
ncbi:MAG: hypothetical protein DRP87_08325 [Spirochaetes bacterium]|nr:MAG: hypothetical protein DRP87_08325 [Spirochaetota bacterium]